jgi:hypothetical protein
MAANTVYPENLSIGPITTWPGDRTPADARRRSQFSAPLRDTLEQLERELYYLRATDVRLEVAIPPDPGYWRNDGRPRAHARADHPGVVLRFKTAVFGLGEVAYSTDRFLSWQENLRAIAKTLQAARMMERYGTTSRGQQYRGFKELPAPQSSMNASEAAAFLHEHGGSEGTTLDQYRRASKALHPDVGGTPELMAKLNEAKEVLGL